MHDQCNKAIDLSNKIIDEVRRGKLFYRQCLFDAFLEDFVIYDKCGFLSGSVSVEFRKDAANFLT